MSLRVCLCLFLFAYEVNAATLRRNLRQPNAQAADVLSLAVQDVRQHPEDAKVRANFVKECTTVTTVKDDFLLPVEALEKLCDGTDAVVECKLRVVKRVQDTHAHGGDMAAACGAIFEWFQHKYADECENQCEKLQCKATCEWLNEHESVLKNETLEDMEARLEAMKTELARLEDDLKDQDAATRAQKDLTDRLGLQLLRAKSAQDSASQGLLDQQARLATAEAAAKQDQGRVDKMEADQEFRSSQVLDTQRQLDMAKVNKSGAEGEVASKEEAFKRAQDSSAEKQADVQKQEASITELQTAVQEKEAEVQQLEAEMEQQLPLLEKRLRAMQKAEADQEQALSDGASSETLTVAEDLVKQQTEAYDKMQAEVDAVNRSLTVAQNGVRLATDEVRMGRKMLQKLQAEAKTAAGAQSAAKVELITAQNAASRAQQATDALKAQLEEQQRMEQAGAAALKSAEITLDSRKKIVAEEEAALEKAEKELKDTQAVYELTKTKESEAKEKLGNMQKKQTQLVKAVQAGTAAWTAHTQELEKGLSAQSADIRRLNKVKPDIVRQHGLALLHALQQ